MKIKIEITISDDEYTEETKEIQVQIDESITDVLDNLDKWEADVRKIGFQTMRELFRCGIESFENKLLSEYRHRDEKCQPIRRGRLDFTLATIFGKVTLQRQRLWCKTCKKWVTPLNEALGLHEEEKERTTLALQQLASLCAVNQPYRLAEKMVKEITQEPEVISHQQIKLIVDQKGNQLRQHEEQDRQRTSMNVVRGILDRQPRSPTRIGQLYICLDGIYVRSHKGKGNWQEGKVGFICTDERESLGHKGRQRIPVKRYVSSFENSSILGSRVYAEVVKMGLYEYAEVIVLGDGARWIREVHRQCFRDAVYILDWYHLHRKACDTFGLTLPDDEKHRRELRREVTGCLWKGQKEKALEKLKGLYTQLLSEGKQELLRQRNGLEELIAYIESNWKGIVNYRQMQKSGYMIASTLVESAVNLVVAKRQKKHQGMHWSRSGADSLSALRTLWLNEEWEDYWQLLSNKVA